jgi:diguanylate cyclase (GGDEF)-like protein
MGGAVVRTTLSLVTPGILCVFAIAFVCAWLIERKRDYLLLMASACGLFALGATSQILDAPPGVGPNAIVSGAFYTSAVLSAAAGITRRSGKPVSLLANVIMFLAFMALIFYFFYVDRNLLARVYIQNFGYGFILLVTAIRIAPLRLGRYVDRTLFWLLLIFALHFFPRTLLTIGFSAPVDKAAFADTMFWPVLQLSLAVLGAGLGFAILAAAVADVMDDLRRERDLDVLTGVLNRRGFEERVSARLQNPVGGAPSFILCDVDKFKSVNDIHGHHAGDAVLREVGGLLRQASRKQDIVGRLGGEEFAVFLPDTTPQDASACAERLREEIERHSFAALPSGVRLTASFGVGTLKAKDSWSSLYERVDERLYEAKRTGRNTTVGHRFRSSRSLKETGRPHVEERTDGSLQGAARAP